MTGLGSIARSLVIGALVSAIGTSSIGHADDETDPPNPTIERDGRGLVFGASGSFLLGATPLTTVDVPDQPVLQPGWAAHGRFGMELPPGIAVALLVGGGGLAAAQGSPPLFLRALAEVRYTLDLGDVRPFASAAGGFFMIKAGPNLRATFTCEASLGIDIPLAPWAAIEGSLAIEVLAPGDALRDVMVFAVLPRIGAGFRY
ncbi:MAG: hypothetical protein J0L92_38870 [Deltaproteobacteria bacterium]|nr:hypothetical protein [Deltaproteobacteria bacterium]